MNPQPREVWRVRDLEVKLHSEERVDKGSRPVLVMASFDLAIPNVTMVNVIPVVSIIPLTTSSKLDELIYPVSRAYYKTDDGFQPDINSAAIIQLYQPILKKYFSHRCGILTAEDYEAIRHTLCVSVIGYPDFDMP